MKRRQFITALGGGAALWPLVLRAQQPAIPVVGFLNSTSSVGYSPYVAAFRDGLKESGYVEGKNVVIEYRWAEGHYDQLPAMAADLVLRQVSVIVANTPANLAAKAATKTIPVVFTTGSDPVKIGLVASLNRPGGNVTGVTSLTVEVMPKRLELARVLMPTATDVALLVNPNNSRRVEGLLKDVHAAADSLGLRLHVLQAATEADIDNAFAGFAQLKAGVLVIGPDPLFSANSKMLAELSLRYSVPTIYEFQAFAEAGGLMSYGGSNKESYRWAGVYTGRILKGAKPADLPVQQSTTVELIINLKTAKALGLTIPPPLLARADGVIE